MTWKFGINESRYMRIKCEQAFDGLNIVTNYLLLSL